MSATIPEYIVAHNGVSSSQYVQAIQTGTEPFTGNADLLTNSFSVSITQGYVLEVYHAFQAAHIASTGRHQRLPRHPPPAAQRLQQEVPLFPSTVNAVVSLISFIHRLTRVSIHVYLFSGIGYTGSTVCASGSTCTVSSPYYSQCL